MELVDSSPSGVVPGGVGMLIMAAVMYGWSQFRGTVSSNLAFRLDRLERLQREEMVTFGFKSKIRASVTVSL